jgi:hypothetical protein
MRWVRHFDGNAFTYAGIEHDEDHASLLWLP